MGAQPSLLLRPTMAMVATTAVDMDTVDMAVDTAMDTTLARDLLMLSQKLMPGTDADTVMEDMVLDTGMAVMVLDMDVDTMAITLARDPLMPPQKPMPGTDVDTATDTAVDTVMVVTDTADSDIMDKKPIVPYLQRNINTNYAIILPNQVITHYKNNNTIVAY